MKPLRSLTSVEKVSHPEPRRRGRRAVRVLGALVAGLVLLLALAVVLTLWSGWQYLQAGSRLTTAMGERPEH